MVESGGQSGWQRKAPVADGVAPTPPKAVVVLLDHARMKRDAAERAWQLARGATTDGLCDQLRRYAEELEQTAFALEQRAVIVAETIAKSRSLTAEVKALVDITRARVEAMRRKTPKQPS
jgi:hypothetical protein